MGVSRRAFVAGLAGAALFACAGAAATHPPAIAFARPSDGVYLVTADGKGAPELVLPGGEVPVWSPNGSLLAASVRQPDDPACGDRLRYAIGVVSPGAEPRLIEPPANRPCARLEASSWSPDGRWIAGTYSQDGSLNGDEIAVVPAAGGAVTVLTRSHSGAAQPTWFPDSRRLVYQDAGGIWTVDRVTRKTRQVIDDFELGGATISPRGTKIAFVGDAGVEVVGVDGRGRKVVARLRNAGSPAWSPKGKSIAFEAGKPFRVYEADPGGAGYRAMTPASMHAIEPSWSPDGRRLVVLANAGAKPGLWTLRSSGGGFVRLTKSQVDFSPAWRPR